MPRPLPAITLIHQYGAIKPPWIHKDDFYKLPFNFCDRWCERCKLSGICRVYQDEKKRKKKFISQGINPKSWNATFMSIQESFDKTFRLLDKEMKRRHIALTDEDDKKYSLMEEQKNQLVQSDHLTMIAKTLSYRLVKLIEDLQYYLLTEITNEQKDHIRIVSYYMHFFYIKICRALYSAIEDRETMCDDVTYDAKNSAFLSYAAITKIVNSLNIIMSYHKLHGRLRQRIMRFVGYLQGLSTELNQQFQLNFIATSRVTKTF